MTRGSTVTENIWHFDITSAIEQYVFEDSAVVIWF